MKLTKLNFRIQRLMHVKIVDFYPHFIQFIYFIHNTSSLTKYILSSSSQDRRAEIVRQNKAKAAQMEELSNNEKSAMSN